MTSGVLGMRSQMSSMRGHNHLATNGITGDINDSLFSNEDIKKYAVHLLEQLDAFMAEDNFEHKSTHKVVAKVCHYLKSEGRALDNDNAFKQQLDLYFDLLRNILRKPKLSPFARTMILEVIELRASNWSANKDIEEYYRRKVSEFEANEIYTENDFSPELQKSQSFGSALIGIDKCPTKSGKPTKMAAKTFLRDEVLIRNGDSGKVMGIKGRRVHLIEEMSDTVISFQKVTAGAKERMVQITGPSEENIERAKELIENTIKRNASPVPFEGPNRQFESNLTLNQNSPEVNFSKVFDANPIQKSDSIIEIRVVPKIAHTFNVDVDNDLIVLSTNNYELGLRAQQLLEQILLKPLKEIVPPKESRKYQKRDDSLSDSTSGDDFDVKPKQTIVTKKTKSVLNNEMTAQNTASDLSQNESKHIRIQRSSSQGTVPIGRTSLRFMDRSDEMEPKSIEKNYPMYSYDRQILMALSQLESSKDMPNIEMMATIYKKTPDIIRKHQNSGENTGVVKSQSFTQNGNIPDIW